ncbi:hypothetical protein L1887_35067 [Cichorium endivia]|nr:hypothetical protein L1887_35067 [Cichorium endivia]
MRSWEVLKSGRRELGEEDALNLNGFGGRILPPKLASFGGDIKILSTNQKQRQMNGTYYVVLSSYEYLSTGLRQYNLENTMDGFYIAPAFMDKEEVMRAMELRLHSIRTDK